MLTKRTGYCTSRAGVLLVAERVPAKIQIRNALVDLQIEDAESLSSRTIR
jgi:hypothetical protein